MPRVSKTWMGHVSPTLPPFLRRWGGSNHITGTAEPSRQIRVAYVVMVGIDFCSANVLFLWRQQDDISPTKGA